MATPEARPVWPIGATLGEGPVWIARENAVYFVDIKQPHVHRFSLADGATASWPMPERIGWIAPRAREPGFIAGFKSGFYKLTLDPFARSLIGIPEPDLPNNRRNDAKTDGAGRIWAGSMDDAQQSATGALFRIDPDLSWRRMDDGYKICNGPTFSPDYSVMYHTDTGENVVYAFDLAPDGAIANKRVFIRFEEGWGHPDGMTTDIEGGIWIAHWGGSRVSRFTPDGKLDHAIAVPAAQVTSCVFAGENLDRMFITSAAIGREGEPLAGALFEADPGVRGAPQPPFAG